MERTYENQIDEKRSIDYVDLYFKACSIGTFGQILSKLDKSELYQLKIVFEEYITPEVRVLAPGILARFIRKARKNIYSLFGKKYDAIPKRLETIWRLQNELSIALGENITNEDELINPDNYFDDFKAYVNSLDERQRGSNVTHLKIKSYVVIGPNQVEPKDNKDGYVIISFRRSFEENLAFIQEHINQAIQKVNIRETESMQYAKMLRNMDKS
jgi:hypothetical protein